MAAMKIGVPQIEVVSKECDGHTGRWTLGLRVVEMVNESSEVSGPLRYYGVDGDTLRDSFGNSFATFVEAQREEMMRVYAGFKISQTAPDLEVGHRI